MIDPLMPTESQKAETLPKQLAFLGAFFGLLSLGSVALTVIFRSGLPIPWHLLAFDTAIFLSAALAPFLLPMRLQGRCFATPYLLSLPCLAVLVSPILGLIGPLGPVLGWVYVLAAMIALYRARRGFAAIVTTELAFGTIAALLVAFYLFGTFNQLNYATIYTPEFAQIGTLRHDTYFHSAIAHMIMSFGKLSPGYDGLGPIHYHIGSHIWFAALAVIGRSNPLFAYPIGQLVVAIPFLYWSVCVVGLILARRAVRSVMAMPTFVLATAIFIDQISWKSYYESESFTLSLAMMICLLPLLLGSAKVAGNGRILVRLAAAVPLSFVLAGVKLSVGFMWGIATAYTAVRRYSPWKVATWVLLAVMAALLLLAFHLFRKITGLDGSLELFYMFTTHALYEGIAASLLVPVATVLLGVWQARRDAAGSLRAAFRTGATFPAELVAAVTVTALVPGSVMVIQGDSWWYFVNVAHWFAFPMLPALVLGERLWLVERDDRRILMSVAALVALAAAWLIWQAGIKPESTLRAGLEPVMSLAKRVVRESVASTEPTTDAPVLGRDSWWRVTSTPLFTPEITNVLAATPGARIAALVKNAAANRIQRFAVHVPSDNRRFWELTPRCETQSLMIPSLAGVRMLYGLPPTYRKCTAKIAEFNGFFQYPDAESRDVTHDELCRRASLRAIQWVFVLSSLSEPDRNQLVDCGTP